MTYIKIKFFNTTHHIKEPVGILTEFIAFHIVLSPIINENIPIDLYISIFLSIFFLFFFNHPIFITSHIRSKLILLHHFHLLIMLVKIYICSANINRAHNSFLELIVPMRDRYRQRAETIIFVFK